ncbi:MAG: hypothetical protein GXO67_07710, partial [Archaeoglobi archaeon]|nr:hypothetical protein [Archaeoglobi archaeon]
RKALESKPERFDSVQQAIARAESRLKTKRSLWERHITLSTQTSLDQFLGSSSPQPSR